MPEYVVMPFFRKDTEFTAFAMAGGIRVAGLNAGAWQINKAAVTTMLSQSELYNTQGCVSHTFSAPTALTHTSVMHTSLGSVPYLADCDM